MRFVFNSSAAILFIFSCSSISICLRMLSSFACVLSSATFGLLNPKQPKPKVAPWLLQLSMVVANATAKENFDI